MRNSILKANPTAAFVMDDEPGAFTLASFAENNADSPGCAAWCGELRALAVGGSFSLGGGACPLSTIRRVS